jgi:hypothetical protein
MARGKGLLEDLAFVMWTNGGSGRACSRVLARPKGHFFGSGSYDLPEDGLCSSRRRRLVSCTRVVEVSLGDAVCGPLCRRDSGSWGLGGRVLGVSSVSRMSPLLPEALMSGLRWGWR